MIKCPQKVLKKAPQNTAKTWHREERKNGQEGNYIVTTTNITVCKFSEEDHVSFLLKSFS